MMTAESIAIEGGPVEAAQEWVRVLFYGDAADAWRLIDPTTRRLVVERFLDRQPQFAAGRVDAVGELSSADSADPVWRTLVEGWRSVALSMLPAAGTEWNWLTHPRLLAIDLEEVLLVNHPPGLLRAGTEVPAVKFRMRYVDGRWLLAGLEPAAEHS